MRIKNAEGQTLLSLMRIVIVFIACLTVGSAQLWAEKTFYFINNAETIAAGFLSRMEEVPAEEQPVATRTTTLYYIENGERESHRIFERYYLAGSEGHLVLTDMAGNQVIDGEYQDVLVLPDAYVLKQNNSWTFVDRTTLEPLSDHTWDEVSPDITADGMLSSNLVLVGVDGLYGAVSLLGEPRIDPIYEEFDIYSYYALWPLIRVKQESGWGFIDLDGSTVVEPKYDYALIDTLTIHSDENDAEGTEVPVIYVLQDDNWGGIFRDSNGRAQRVDWDVDPSAEAMAAYETSV